VLQRISLTTVDLVEPGDKGAAAGPSTAAVRTWARSAGLSVPDRGRLRPEIWSAWQEAHPTQPD
jgi:hypothetical protein